MKNRVVNFAAEQIKSNEINKKILESTFFKEYYKVFCNNNEFDDDIIANLNSDIDINELTKISNIITGLFKNKLNVISRLGIENEIGLILFIGDGDVDGHSIILDNYVYIFIDVKSIILRSNLNFNLDSFLSHEIIHITKYYYFKLRRQYYGGLEFTAVFNV